MWLTNFSKTTTPTVAQQPMDADQDHSCRGIKVTNPHLYPFQIGAGAWSQHKGFWHTPGSQPTPFLRHSRQTPEIARCRQNSQFLAMSERNGHSLDPVSSTLVATRVGDTGLKAVSVPFQHSRDPGRSPNLAISQVCRLCLKKVLVEQSLCLTWKIKL